MNAHSLRHLFARRAARQTKQNLNIEILEGRQLLSVGSPVQVDSGNQAVKYEVANATSSDGSSVVVWAESAIQSGNSYGDLDIRAQKFNASGAKMGPEIYVAGKVGINEDEPSVAMDAHGDFVVSWTEHETNGDTNVLAHQFNASSVPINGIVQVGVGTFREHQSSVASDAQGNFVVAYTRDTNNNNSDVFAKQYNASSQLLGVITVAGTAHQETDPSIAMTPDGHFDIAYQSQYSSTDNDIYVSRYTSTGSLLGSLPVAVSTSLEEAPSIAMDNQGDAVVAYQKSVGGNYDIKANRISASGVLGGQINIRSTSAAEMDPKVAFQPNGGYAGAFAVTYNQFNGSALPDVEVATVDGSNTVTHIYEFSDTFSPAISAQGADGFLLSYGSYNGANSNNIFARRGSYF